MNKLLFLLFPAFCLISDVLQGQSTFSYGINPYYGAVFRYKADMPKVKFTNLYGAEVFIKKQTDGSRYWESKHNYPQLGLSAAYYNYGDPDELGQVFLTTGFIDYNLSGSKKHEFRLNLGTGLVYSDVIYHGQNNPENKAIGAPLSYVLRGTVYYSYKLNAQFYLNANFAFRHFSNGRMNMPNNGMNFPIAGLGIEYSPKETPILKTPEKAEDYIQKLRINLFGGIAWREVHREDYKHKAYTVSAYLSKRISWYSTFLLGTDGFYYTPASMKKHLSVDGILLEEYEIDGRQMAITAGHELHFGKLSFLFQAGYYVHDPHEVWSAWYQRYGLKYCVTNFAFGQVSLKSHSRTANMVEWGVGLSL